MKLRHFSPGKQSQRSNNEDGREGTGLSEAALTVVVFLAAFPESRVEVAESKLVLSRLPDVVNGVGQLPLPDLGQLVPPGRGQRAVVGVLSGTLWRDTDTTRTC